MWSPSRPKTEGVFFDRLVVTTADSGPELVNSPSDKPRHYGYVRFEVVNHKQGDFSSTTSRNAKRWPSPAQRYFTAGLSRPFLRG